MDDMQLIIKTQRSLQERLQQIGEAILKKLNNQKENLFIHTKAQANLKKWLKVAEQM